MLIKILGSGSSGGVPLIGPYWGDCNPNNPKNKRRRVSIAIEILNKTILIDTSPDLREQSIDCNINKIDAVLWTHAHADHVNGIDDIRQFLWKRKEKLPVFASRETLDTLKRRFDYVFDNNNAYFKPPLDPKSVNPGYFNIHNIKILAIEQFHGKEITYGYRINNFAYSTDVNSFPENSFNMLKNLDLWIVDCVRYEPHYSHAHLDLTLEWISKLKPKKAILTHLGAWLDYDELKSKCPFNVEPAYDGLIIDLT